MVPELRRQPEMLLGRTRQNMQCAASTKLRSCIAPQAVLLPRLTLQMRAQRTARWSKRACCRLRPAPRSVQQASVLWCRRPPAELHGPCAVNSVVEYNAARVLQASYAAGLRREMEQRRARRAGGKRRHSADFSRPALHLAGIGRHSFDVRTRLAACVQ